MATGFADLYTEGDTFLHRLDPRVKLITVILITLLAFLLSNVLSLLTLLALIFLLLLVAKVRLRKARFALKHLLRFMALVVILWPIFDPSGLPVLAQLGPFKITEPALLRGVTSALRIGCFASVWFVLLFTTSQRDLVRALVKLGLRFDFGLAISIALRFIPTFGGTIDSVKDAQRARGLDFGRGGLLKRSKDYVAILAPAIVSALRTAETLTLALQSRAYGARKDRTYLRELSLRRSDVVALLLAILLLVVPVATRHLLSVPL
jgi:energy-coupling factor transport system permease protein